jgi:hypothetical protein
MKTEGGWGRFTARGGAEVEAEIEALVRRAGELVEASLPRGAYRALLLTGGYGRGEGGVERRGGVERPHNNLDFLLITPGWGGSRQVTLKRELDRLFQPLVEAGGVGIDTGVIGEWKLRTAPCLVRWFDLRFGHKTVLGDPRLVPSLTRFRKEAIDPADALALLVNRSSLLVINDMLLARGALGDADRKAIVKNVMKAIIGYGDAYLFAFGLYDVSYAEKQRRMRSLRLAPALLRELYEEAVEFRFSPSYQRFLDRDLCAWMTQLRDELARVHLFFEAWRLGVPGLTWSAYPALALRRSLSSALRSPGALARRLRDLAASARRKGERGGSPLRGLALRCVGPRGALSLALPVVLYGAGDVRYADLARRALGAADTSETALRHAYLARWGEHGDINFSATARALDLPVAPLEAAL